MILLNKGCDKLKQVIIDVDTGIDDALALVLALNSNKLNVRGITTVSGNTPLEFATENTLKVLKLLGREDIQVYKGCNKPKARDIIFRDSVHGENGLAGQLKNLETKQANKKHAVDYIIDEVNSYPGEISLIMLAPLTNLAMAFEKAPEIKNKIKELYIMGGVVDGRGNESPVAEFNFYIDPESAYEVLHSGVPIKLIGLDVTRKAQLLEEELDNIKDKSDLAKFVYNVSKYYIDKYSVGKEVRSCALHDPLAVAVAIDEDVVVMKDYFVDVEYSSRLCDGQSICDFNNRYGNKPNVKVALELKRDKFMKMFLESIKWKDGANEKI